MDTIKIHFVHDDSGSDKRLVEDLTAKLGVDFNKRSLALEPELVLQGGFLKLPPVAKMEPLSLACLILPERARNGFTDVESDAIDAFRQGCPKGDIRLVPLSLAPDRDKPPEPISGLVSQKVHNLADPDAITRLGNFLLNLACLRLSGGKRKIFISYKLSDGGKEIATHLADRLKDRGYEVWRDELLDRDGTPLIGPGTEAQETIERAICDNGFVLVLDTPEASQSKWVHAEIDTAYGMMLPLLPVVIEDPARATSAQPPLGGNFTILRNMQREERIKLQDFKGASPGGVIAAMGDAFFDRLEHSINRILTEHLRTRLALIRETEREFKALQFNGWRDIAPSHLIYEAVRDWHKPLSPRLALRLIVQCAPYDILQEDLIVNLAAQYAASQGPTQYAVLVHPTSINSADKDRLLRQSQGHLLLLTPGEIAKLPSLFELDSGGHQ